jgi:hypothetical protein
MSLMNTAYLHTIYLTMFSIAAITLSIDKLICEYRGESHLAVRGRELTWPATLHFMNPWCSGKAFKQ